MAGQVGGGRDVTGNGDCDSFNAGDESDDGERKATLRIQSNAISKDNLNRVYKNLHSKYP